MFCYKCGREIPDDSAFCNYCGAKLNYGQSDLSVEENNTQDGILDETGKRDELVADTNKTQRFVSVNEDDIEKSTDDNQTVDLETKNEKPEVIVEPSSDDYTPVTQASGIIVQAEDEQVGHFETELSTDSIEEANKGKSDILSGVFKKNRKKHTIDAKTLISRVNGVRKRIKFTKRNALIAGIALIAVIIAILFGTKALCFHDWQDATCTEPMICSKCHKKKGEPLGHDSTKATCEEEGKCKRCGWVTEAPLGHDIKEWVTSTEPTCTSAGAHKGTCTRCGQEISEEVDALGHEWGEWQTAKKPTCTQDGTNKRQCNRCKKEETQPVEKLGHNWSDWVTKGGYQKRSCSRCKKEEKRDLPAISSGTLTVFDNKDLKIVFDADAGNFEFTNKTSNEYIVDFVWGSSQSTLNGHKLNPWDFEGGTLGPNSTLICALTLARDGETLAGEKMHEGDYIKDGNNTLSVQFEYGKPDKDWGNIISSGKEKTASFKLKVDRSVVDRW